MSLPTIFVSIWLISVWLYFRRGRSVRRALVIGVGLHVVVVALIWGGPLSSGGKAVVETAVTRPDGSRTTHRWNEKRRQDLEIHEGSGESPIMVQYARADGIFAGSLTISCTKDGRPVSETVEVWPGDEARVKHEVIDRICAG